MFASADKMVMLPPLFDSSKPEVVKQHYERFNQYIKFQTKSGNIRGPVGEAIELLEHTLDKKALVWFQEHRDKFVDLTTLKTMFLQRYNPWGKTKQDQLKSWNILIFDPQKTDVDEHIDLINTYQCQYQNNSYQGHNYQGNQGLYHNPCRNFQQGNNYGQFRGRSHG